MRTTVDIPDPLYRKLKSRAAMEGSTVKAAILHAVTRELNSPASAPPKSHAQLPLIKAKEKRRLNLTNAQINDILFE